MLLGSAHKRLKRKASHTAVTRQAGHYGRESISHSRHDLRVEGGTCIS